MKTPYKMKGSPMQRNFGIGSPVKYEKDPYEFRTRKGGEEIEAMGPRDKEGRYGEGGFAPDFIMDQHLKKTKTKPTTDQKQDTKKEKPKKKHEMSKSKWWNPKTQSWE